MNMEFNKLFAAFLVAGIVASAGGFIAREVAHPEMLEENAYKVEVAEAAPAGGGAAAPATAEPIDDLLKTADVGHGEKVAKVCAACHTFDKGGANKVGPNLNGVVGLHHAHKDDYAYSDAMKAKSGDVWTEQGLNEFLFNPKKAIPGTKMSFAGLKKAEDRAAVIKWIESQK